jgi:hypothetical protein
VMLRVMVGTWTIGGGIKYVYRDDM